jgi:uncharacterized membrane protein YozB (DUF420 family)
MIDSARRQSSYLWLCLAISATAYYGFSITYFGPILAGEYPESSPTVHLHGWTFFLWYLLLPLQSGLIKLRRVAWHRLLGTGSVALAAAMVGTGLVVLGAQMQASLQPDGPAFWQAMGPAVFSTLVLFALFYTLGLRARRDRDRHRRFMLLASAGGLGAACFRIASQYMGSASLTSVVAVGILAPNLFVLLAIAMDWRRGRGIHRVYRWGLPVSIGVEAAAFLITPTPVGRAMIEALAWIGRVTAPLY